MLVKIFTSVNDFDSFEIESTNLIEILNIVKFKKGRVYTDNIIYTPHAFMLVDKVTGDKVSLILEVITSELDPSKDLYILPEIIGEIPVPIILAIALASATGLSVAAAGTILAVAGTIAIIGVGVGVMMMMSPTATISSDPSAAQNKHSSLFNNSPVAREQGGIVPLIYGNPYCSGVLISSGLSTEDSAGVVTV
jgi:hypothetical protein